MLGATCDKEGWIMDPLRHYKPEEHAGKPAPFPPGFPPGFKHQPLLRCCKTCKHVEDRAWQGSPAYACTLVKFFGGVYPTDVCDEWDLGT